LLKRLRHGDKHTDTGGDEEIGEELLDSMESVLSKIGTICKWDFTLRLRNERG